jgi:hypothetical protein
MLLLTEALDAWAAADAKPRGFDRNSYPRSVRATVLRRFLGIGIHPGSLEDCIDLPDHPRPPSESSIPGWRDEWARSEEAREAAGRHMRAVTAWPKYVEWPPPVWRGSSGSWPPVTGWPVPGNGFDERASLLRSAHERIADSARPESPTGEVPGEVASVLEEQLLAILRGLAIPMLDAHFRREEESRRLRYLGHVVDPWQSTSTSTSSVGDPDEATAETVAVAAQLYFHLAVHPLMAQELADHVTASLERAALPSRTAVSFRQNIVTWKDTAAPKYPKDLDRRVAWLLETASLMREDPQHAEGYASSYLAARLDLELGPDSLLAAIHLALADQSASLDIAKLGNAELLGKLRRAIEATGKRADSGHAYAVLIDRDLGIIELNGRGEHYALAMVSLGFKNLNHLLEQRLVDARSGMEVRHQLALAAAGQFVRLVERRLTSIAPEIKQASSQAAYSLHFATTTAKLLEELDGRFPLPATRREGHETGRISAASWQIRTRVIVLRCQLAAITALESGVARPEGLRTRDGMVKAPDMTDAIACYLDLVARPEVGSADVREVMSLGMWLALLNRGRIPVGYELTPALRDLEITPLIDAVVDGMHPTSVADRPFNLMRVAEWLGSQHWGVIGRVPVESPVGVMIEDRYPGYATWRASLPDETHDEGSGDSSSQARRTVFDLGRVVGEWTASRAVPGS